MPKLKTHRAAAKRFSLTKNGKVRLTAEIIYRFISKDNDFVESHTGLEDVTIETEILAYCKRQHKKMRKKLYE